MTQSRSRYEWFAIGDVNGFFGLMFDNVTVLSFLAGILVFAFGFPADIVYTKMFPGTAFGVLFGDLVYTWMAFRLARKTGQPQGHRDAARPRHALDDRDRARRARPRVRVAQGAGDGARTTPR